MKFIEVAIGVVVNFDHVEEIHFFLEQDWVEIIMRDGVIRVVFGHKWRESEGDPDEEAYLYGLALLDALKKEQSAISFQELEEIAGAKLDECMVEHENLPPLA